MAPKIERDLDRALVKLANAATSGPMTERGEFAMDAEMNAVIRAKATVLGGKGARSKAIRELIMRGARAELAERQASE